MISTKLIQASSEIMQKVTVLATKEANECRVLDVTYMVPSALAYLHIICVHTGTTLDSVLVENRIK